MFFVVIPYVLMKNVDAMAFWPFVILRSADLEQNKVLIHHEKIHLRQQKECFFVFFYLWYLLEFTYYYLKYNSPHKAYRSISFEREAYDNEYDFDYLSTRKLWAFSHYL